MKNPAKLKENWEIFKAEYTHQMDELDREFTGFTDAIKKVNKNGNRKIKSTAGIRKNT